MWVVFFIFEGALNIYVAKHYSESTWVNFKLFGLMGITLVFALLQGVWLSRQSGAIEPRAGSDRRRPKPNRTGGDAVRNHGQG